MELYAGLALHSRNTFIGILDKESNQVFKKRVPNKIELILETLNPFQDQLKGLVVESTFNWYWLVDGLMDAGYHGVLPQIEDTAPRNFKSFEEMERVYILQVLKAKNWRIGGENSAASTLGMHVNTLRGRMKKLGIKKPALRYRPGT